MPDAEVLRAAVAVLRRRSRRPNGFWLRILCRVLLDVAELIEAEQATHA